MDGRSRHALDICEPGGLVITVRGNAARFEQAFRVHIKRFVRGAGSSFFANTSAPQLPRWLNVQTVTGLDNVHHAVYVGLHPLAARKHDSPAGGYTPEELRAAYNMCSWQMVAGKRSCVPYSVNGTPVDGTGQTIGITGFGQSVKDSNFKSFATATGEPAITSCTGCTGPDKVQWYLLDGTNNDPSLDEQALDIRHMSSSLALHSDVKYWLGDDGSDPGMEDAIDAASKDPSVHVVSNSWGDPGPESASKTNPFVVATANSFKRAVAVGTTFYFSTGDNAADSGCLDVTSHCGQASYPATSPYVVAVGGTNLQMNSSFTSWQSESTWNLSRGDDSGSGGGCAPFFARPAWQKGVADGATCGGRAIPDVSAAADLDNSPVEVWLDGPEQVGGTSVSASLISGMAATTNRYLELEHASTPSVPASMGFAAPEIYKLAQTPYYDTYFHDVLCGSNTFPARLGWDEATGLGAINWYPYSEGFAGITPASRTPPPTYWTCGPQTSTGSNLSTVSCGKSHRCVAGGAGGTLLASTDAWFWDGPTVSSARAAILSVACPSSQDCYAVTSTGWLQHTSDGGKNWQARKLGVGPVMSIACPGVSDCLVAGSGIGRSLNGTHFVRAAVPQGAAFVAVSCGSVTVCFAIRADGTVVKTIDGGSVWSAGHANPVAGAITSLSCPTPTSCYAVGMSNVPNDQGGTLVGGPHHKWRHVVSSSCGKSGSLASVSCFKSSCEAAGGTTVIRTIDGVHWQSIYSSGSDPFNAITCPAASLCYAVGEHGRIVQLGAGPGH